jgi:hypothetical protein
MNTPAPVDIEPEHVQHLGKDREELWAVIDNMAANMKARNLQCDDLRQMLLYERTRNERLEQSATAAEKREQKLLELLRGVPTHVCLDVAEIPGRDDSPDDQPEMMLVTNEELARITAHWINNAIEGSNDGK